MNIVIDEKKKIDDLQNNIKKKESAEQEMVTYI
jgi:hypothetical protein